LSLYGNINWAVCGVNELENKSLLKEKTEAATISKVLGSTLKD